VVCPRRIQIEEIDHSARLNVASHLDVDVDPEGDPASRGAWEDAIPLRINDLASSVGAEVARIAVAIVARGSMRAALELIDRHSHCIHWIHKPLLSEVSAHPDTIGTRLSVAIPTSLSDYTASPRRIARRYATEGWALVGV
jgi:hypothetical protein